MAPVEFSRVERSIVLGAKELYGMIGSGELGIRVIRGNYDEKMGRGIVRVGLKGVDTLRTIFAFIKKIDEQEVIMRAIGVSGILSVAKKRYLMSN